MYIPGSFRRSSKIKKISYIHAEGYPAAEMNIQALIDENMPVVFIVSKTGYSKILSNIEEVKARGDEIIIITSVNSEELNHYSKM